MWTGKCKIFTNLSPSLSIRACRIYSYFQLFWLRAICFNDELIPGVSLQLCKPEQQCLLHMSGSGPSCNRRLITAGEAKSKNGTQLPPAALNYFPNTRFPFLLFSVSSLVSAAFLFVSDLFLFPVFFPSVFSSISITWPPHLPLFISWSQFPARSLSASSSAFVLLQDPAEGIWFGSFRLVLSSLVSPERARLPVRSREGALRLWANPEKYFLVMCMYLYLQFSRIP